MTQGSSATEHSILLRAKWCVTWLAIPWLVELANVLEGHVFHTWGILPRTAIGLRGILFGPFLHGSPEHLALNSVPLLVLSWLVLTNGTREFVRVTLTVMLVGGVCVWSFARPHYHIGASLLVFGYFGSLVANLAYQRTWNSFFVAALTLLLYGRLIFSIFPARGPGQELVSWESHLFGLIAGALAAWAGASSRRRK